MSRIKLRIKLSKEEAEYLNEFCRAVGQDWERVAKHFVLNGIEKTIQKATQLREQELAINEQHNTPSRDTSGIDSEAQSLSGSNSTALPVPSDTSAY